MKPGSAASSGRQGVNVNGKHYRTIWLSESNPEVIQIIDQRHLPHRFVVEDLMSVEEAARAIKEMHVRGAGLIGATAGYGMYLAALHAPRHSEAAFVEALRAAGERLKATRPTAVNLEWMVARQLEAVGAAQGGIEAKIEAACETAQLIADEDAEFCRRIGEHGVGLIEAISERKQGEVVNVLTHCNAGWLAFVDYGTATAPIYAAHDRGIRVHVWVDETRPRNQGARLTAWELGQHEIPHTVIADNVGGHLMQHGMVDLMITGTDRTLYTGDVANKVGTYLKALAARDNDVPFYVALPSSTFDWVRRDGVREIPIEQRDAAEVKSISGLHEGEIVEVLLTPEDSPAANYAFDVTPAHLVSGLITERGICAASEEGILALYPEKRPAPGKEA
jgi:methylthioribose-1-phosphate isomerase